MQLWTNQKYACIPGTRYTSAPTYISQTLFLIFSKSLVPETILRVSFNWGCNVTTEMGIFATDSISIPWKLQWGWHQMQQLWWLERSRKLRQPAGHSQDLSEWRCVGKDGNRGGEQGWGGGRREGRRAGWVGVGRWGGEVGWGVWGDQHGAVFTLLMLTINFILTCSSDPNLTLTLTITVNI